MLFRALQELGRREGTILTVGPGGSKNPLMTPEERERIRRRYRRSGKENNQTSEVVVQRRAGGSVLTNKVEHKIPPDRKQEGQFQSQLEQLSDINSRSNQQNDDRNVQEICSGIKGGIRSVKITIRETKNRIAELNEEIEQAKRNLETAKQDLIRKIVSLGYSISPDASTKILRKLIPGLEILVGGAEKLTAMNTAEQDLLRKKNLLSIRADLLSRDEADLARLEQEFQAKCSGRKNQ